jgi:hypothetical protein
MKQFLDKDIHRKIVVRNHCNGFQVYLCDDGREINRGVDATIESAFEEAIKYFDLILRKRNEEDKKTS